MGKRRYTHIKFPEAEIVAMREAGKTKREIAEHYGLETEQVKGLLKRYRSREKKIAAGVQPRSKGRPRKDGQAPHRQEKAELEQLHKYENLLNREFQSDRPNHKWVTDISYIRTGQGVLCLSVIRDLFDGSVVAHKTGMTQTVDLVLDTIRLAMQREKKAAAELQLHSDQGSQYTSQAYFDLTNLCCLYILGLGSASHGCLFYSNSE